MQDGVDEALELAGFLDELGGDARLVVATAKALIGDVEGGEYGPAKLPGEDISDRPGPEASVPGLLALITGDQPSGRYEARAVVPEEVRAP